MDPGDRDRELLALVDAGFDRAAARAGEHLLCGAGCSDCCHGPFPVTRLDVWRLRRGMERLEKSDSLRAAALVVRAEATARTLSEGYPGDSRTGRLDPDAELDPFVEGHRRLPCPVLDPATGRCELYAFRPIACRTYGPPQRYGSKVTEPCQLCFTEADPETVEACGYEADPDGVEEGILADLGVPEGEEWEMPIAFAVIK